MKQDGARTTRPLPEMIADRIREKGHTQIEAAEKLGVSGPAVSRWISGKTYPEDRNYKAIASCLGITVHEVSAIVHDDKSGDEARGIGPQVAELREKVAALTKLAESHGFILPRTCAVRK